MHPPLETDESEYGKKMRAFMADLTNSKGLKPMDRRAFLKTIFIAAAIAGVKPLRALTAAPGLTRPAPMTHRPVCFSCRLRAIGAQIIAIHTPKSRVLCSVCGEPVEKSGEVDHCEPSFATSYSSNYERLRRTLDSGDSADKYLVLSGQSEAQATNPIRNIVWQQRVDVSAIDVRAQINKMKSFLPQHVLAGAYEEPRKYDEHWFPGGVRLSKREG